MVLKWAEISLKTFAGTVIDATAKLSPYNNEMHFHIFDLGSFKTPFLVLLQSLMLLVPQGSKIIC